MKTNTKLWTTILALPLAALLTASGCDVDQVEDGEMPSMDVDVEGDSGELPEYDVETPEVEASMEDTTVPMPDVDVDMEDETIKTPDIDLNLPDEDDGDAAADPNDES